MPVVSTLEASRSSDVKPGKSGSPPDPFDRIAEIILRIRPISWQALSVAFFALLLGAVLQTLVVLTAGSGIPFAGFFPAIGLAAILAGAPAGVTVSAGSLAFVWWAVKEPRFTFHVLSVQEQYELARRLRSYMS